MDRVYVAMSGGVDSAAAAVLLCRAGYDVTGVTLRLHGYKDRPGVCGSADDIKDAAAVAAALGFPHRVMDLTERFRERVMERFVEEYRAGRTPNPCIDCNREVKFGALFDAAMAEGADYLATGHYARVGYDEASGRWLLLRGLDRKKDQSYVLYQLAQRQLAHLLLPVGEYEKPAIRAMAEGCGLVNAHKPDSQDICFVPDGDYMKFLESFGGVVPEPGDFVDRQGRVLGRHKGLERYTTGQRKGLGVSAAEPLYVLGKDLPTGTVLLGRDAELYTDTLIAERVNWISVPGLDAPMEVTAKTRYSQSEAAATVEELADGRIRVRFERPQRAITAGQAVVLYDGERVVGGGTIV
ncbi:tRNA 2-thiouridine(34) synthase MnmA [Oscillibacter sp. MSJ-2]|uniref:tRNA-specific 2-thiouridylase MnmA n=1 Tax=Dysosmobacter acutus TaxID=2841504 RepID=A0ABS6F5W9_9FIRM|nr:tRNA 2-thiouridine(34) synthase MnmA [Dysosmobacter acutus]MBU5625694.1 tRNA 2-thiouridine(34) synthase MnmA [Dysosmobacter acutus]